MPRRFEYGALEQACGSRVRWILEEEDTCMSYEEEDTCKEQACGSRVRWILAECAHS